MNENFLRLVHSEINNSKNIVNDLKYLLDTKVLDKDEVKIIDYILSCIETTGIVPNYSDVLNKFHLDNEDYNNFQSIATEDLTTYLQTFILEYKQYKSKKLFDRFKKLSTTSLVPKEMIDTFTNNFFNEHKLKDTNLIEDLENINEYLKKDCFLTGYSEIDEATGGIPFGSLTAVTGSLDDDKSIFTLNVAYNAILQGKNVLYFSIGCSSKRTLLKFLVRHSCTFANIPFSLTDLENNKYDIDSYNKTLDDFKDKYMKHLIIIDESNFDFFNTTVLIRLFIYNNEQFKSTTNCGIDIVFIDDLSFMKLENNKRLNITNMNMILNTYLSFLRQQCKNFLNTGSSIIVIVSIRGTDYGLYKAECNGEYFSLDCNYKEVQTLCDNIISVCKQKQSLLLKIQLVKSVGYTINMPVSVLYDENYCAIGNNIEVLQIEDEKKTDF